MADSRGSTEPGRGLSGTPAADGAPALRTALRRAGVTAAVLAGVSLVAAIVVLAARDDLDKAMRVLADAPVWLVLVVVAFATLNYVIRTWRFVYLAGHLGLRMPFWETSAYYTAGFALTMSPGKLGEMVRLWFLKRRFDLAYRRGLALQLADRISDVYAMLLLCLAGLTGFEQYRGAVLAVLAVAAAGTLLIARPRLLNAMLNAIYGIVRVKPRLFIQLRHMVRDTALVMQGRVFLASLTLGIASWFVEAVALWAVLHLLGAPVTLSAATFVFGFAAVVGGLTMTPGGVGGFEIVMVMLLGLQGVPTEVALVATAILRLGTVWYATVAGFLAVPVAVRLSAPKPVAA
ncbi:lysylphosphatidylglycerol synthase transmembrane domain-containing protein [Rhodoplanes azumiensis]|uniref:Lysylphosphatidylglycerol synthase transmembrane domain-containing protein n=1 Tax=Rhodoplanes azumiensis TaxID=1897628 RepID=A0ABW5AHC5_9BRAD